MRSGPRAVDVERALDRLFSGGADELRLLPMPMPEDLSALTNAIVGGEGSIRVESGERCR